MSYPGTTAVVLGGSGKIARYHRANIEVEAKVHLDLVDETVLAGRWVFLGHPFRTKMHVSWSTPHLCDVPYMRGLSRRHTRTGTAWAINNVLPGGFVQ